MGNNIKVRKIVRGKAKGEAMIYKDSFSFLGDVDLGSAEIIAENSEVYGLSIKDKILIYDETKGSSGGMVVLMTLAKKGLAPAAIVSMKPVDYNLAEGAILTQIPFVCQPEKNLFELIKTGDILFVNSDEGYIEFL